MYFEEEFAVNIKSIHANVWIGSLLIVLSAIFYHMANDFINPAAAVWPKGVLIITIILSVMLVIQGARLTAQKVESKKTSTSAFAGAMVSLVAIVIYAVLMENLGFFISTAIFCPIGMYALGQRKWLTMFGVTAGLDLFVYVLFVTQLQLQMP